ncbi:MAG: PilN domain-containing protein [Woeseiaceae bacterium]|nr:PilN domain-containing protein [Woeseiaceae bacterium]
MNDIDLIPVDYRDWLQRRRMLIVYSTSIVLLGLAVAAAGAGLKHTTSTMRDTAARLKVESAVTQQQQDQLQLLTEQRAEYERRWSLLRGLRAGASIQDIFTLIDESLLPGELWFVDWTFRRAGVIVNGQQRGIETGYFIIVADEPGQPAENTMSVETHMTISGQARDHQALSSFVRSLFEQQDVKDVNVRKTTRSDYANTRVVNFDLTIVLNNSLKES